MLTVQRRLLYILFPALTLMMLAGGYIDYHSTISAVNAAYDQPLIDQTSEIASYVISDEGALKFLPPPHLEQSLYSADVGSRLFAIINHDGRLIAGNTEVSNIGHSASVEKNSLSDIVVRQRNYRVSILRQNTPVSFVVMLAEPASSRINIQRTLITNILFVDFMELDLVLLLAWLSIYFALRPLNRMQVHIEQQSHLQLQQFDVTLIPIEIRPFVVTFNHLVELLNEAGLRQRQFVANAAHQLRTPLAGLKAQLQLLMHRPAAQQLQEELTSIDKSLKRLTHSTNQLLMLARAEGSIVTMSDRFQNVDLKMLVQQCLEINLNRADLAQIDLGMEAESVEISGEINLLEDLLNNLVDNALKYTPAGGQVTVRCGAREGRSFLEVEDNGPGIPESARIKVRERFYRQPDATGSGSGLGLAIVDEICRVHHAQLVFGEGSNHQGANVKVLFRT